MALRARAESAALVSALLLCGAFLVSLVLGLRGERSEVVVESANESTISVPDRDAGRVEVLNASARGGVARNVTNRLRDAGFDVVYFGNASGFSRDTSVVVARVPSDAVARAAARRLGINLVRTQVDTTLYLDATVVIARDWLAQTETTARTEKGFWARMRDWLR